MDAALVQGAEIAIRHMQETEQIPSWIDPLDAAEVLIEKHEETLRGQL